MMMRERRFLLTGAMCRQKIEAARRPEDDEASAGKRKGRRQKKARRETWAQKAVARRRGDAENETEDGASPPRVVPLFLSKPRRASRSRSCLRGHVTLGPYGTKTDLATFGPSRHLGPRYWTLEYYEGTWMTGIFLANLLCFLLLF